MNSTAMSMITVRMLFFGAARDAVGEDEIKLQVNSGATVVQARDQMFAKFPGLNRFGNSLLMAVNQEYADANRQLRDGDEVAMFPPVSGGEASTSQDLSRD